MIGGRLFGTAGRRALIAAAGIMAGSVAAQAADLGGNCCADLEERVAELEATTARKGNRKVSLTVYGQVNEAVVWFDDGHESNAYVLTNENSRTRFGFRGDAKINADWSAGYLLEIGVSASNSGTVDQLNDDNGGGFALRHSAWYLDSKQLGRVWVGQTSSASDGIASINLSQGALNSSSSIFDFGGGKILRRGANAAVAGTAWSALSPVGGSDLGDGSRRNLVRYVSPTLAGFIFSAAWGEDDFWDVALRYAGEFSGFRIAAGVAYQNIRDTEFGCTGGQGAAATVKTADCESIGASGSIMHVATGLYIHGAWGQYEDNLVQANANLGLAAAQRDGTSNYWYVQGGIEQKFFSLGKTTIYGEYYSGEFGTSVAVTDAERTLVAGNGFVAGVIGSSDVEMWGVGLVQNVEAAAMDLYLGYKNFSADLNTTAGKQSPDDLRVFYAGGIIRF
jgi:hypothetical protein